MQDKKYALYVPQGFAVHTNGRDGVSAVLIEGMGPCTWATLYSTDRKKPFLAATHADLDTDLGVFIVDAIKSGGLGRNFKIQMGSKQKFDGDQINLVDIYSSKIRVKLEELGIRRSEQDSVFEIDQEDSASILIGSDGRIIKRAQTIYLHLQDVEGHKFEPSSLRSGYSNELYAERTSFMSDYRTLCIANRKMPINFPWQPVVIWRNGDVGDVASRAIYGQIFAQIKYAAKKCPRAMNEYLSGGGTLFDEEYESFREPEMARRIHISRVKRMTAEEENEQGPHLQLPQMARRHLQTQPVRATTHVGKLLEKTVAESRLPALTIQH